MVVVAAMTGEGGAEGAMVGLMRIRRRAWWREREDSWKVFVRWLSAAVPLAVRREVGMGRLMWKVAWVVLAL